MSPAEVGALSLLGAVLGLDVVSFPQAMLSRPLVAATLTGALLGTPGMGLVLGVTLECFALETLPVGASRYPEWGSSSVVGASLLGMAPDSRGSALLLAVVMSLAWAWVGGWSMVQLRRLNARRARARHEAVAQGTRSAVVELQLFGMTADLARGALMTAIGIVAFAPVVRWALPQWTSNAALSGAVLMAMAGIIAAAAVHKVFHLVLHTRWWFAGGIVLGLALLGIVQ
ncbi:MAG: PTS sugar transporter subunit IIC [Gemmatimonadaceae bacterium]